jgi:hypothetical protein
MARAVDVEGTLGGDETFSSARCRAGGLADFTDMMP